MTGYQLFKSYKDAQLQTFYVSNMESYSWRWIAIPYNKENQRFYRLKHSVYFSSSTFETESECYNNAEVFRANNQDIFDRVSKRLKKQGFESCNFELIVYTEKI